MSSRRFTSSSTSLASPFPSSLTQMGGTFLLINALSTKLLDLLSDTTNTLIQGYSRHGGLLGLIRSKEFKMLFRRYMMLVALGVAFERVKWMVGFLSRHVGISSLSQYFYIDALLKPNNVAYDWMLHYWSTHPRFVDRSRDFVIESGPRSIYPPGSVSGSSARAGRKSSMKFITHGGAPGMHGSGVARLMNPRAWGHLFGEVEGAEGEQKQETRVSPKDNDEQWIWHDRTLFRLRRFMLPSSPSNSGYDSEPISHLSIRCYSFTRAPLFSLLSAAQSLYDSTVLQHSISIRVLDANGGWRKSSTKHRRSLESIILEEDKKERLLEDAREFLQAERWYATRGIGWRRGYLLSGSPGTGKSSTIQALASEIQLDVYCININSTNMTDSLLAASLRSVPSRSIVVIEDIDATFSVEKRNLQEHAANASAASGSVTVGPPASRGRGIMLPGVRSGMARRAVAPAGPAPYGSLSLSGILNCIDGVESNDGRLLFMTTNASLDTLDPALIRPGRVDMFITYTRATRLQATKLFQTFYSPSPLLSSKNSDESKPDTITSAVVHADGLSASHPFELPPHITPSDIQTMAKEWAEHVDDEEFSVAELQGQLLQYKRDPEEAVRKMEGWVREKRAEKAAKESKEGEDGSLHEDSKPDGETSAGDKKKCERMGGLTMNGMEEKSDGSGAGTPA